MNHGIKKLINIDAGSAIFSVQPGLSKIAFRQKYPKQKGATLFTALIFLIMLILLGAGAAQMSGLEERMAGNARNRDIAFQAAEAALSYVQATLGTNPNFIQQKTTAAGTGGYQTSTAYGSGLRSINTCLPNTLNYWNGNGDTACDGTTQQFTWSTTAPAANPAASNLPVTDTLAVATQPMYVVERYPDILCPGNATLKQQQYRATVRGVGGDNNTVVILQAMFTVCY